MGEKIKTFLIGRRLHNKELHGEKLNVFWGLPIMASDAISSVAYGVEEILYVLIVLSIAAYQNLFYVAAAIVVLLLILVVSYRQTIDNYPHGGGSYTVAKENLGETPGLAAAASLVIGYVLTVAVSTSAGTAAITSAVPALLPYNVLITLFLIFIMTIGNLRGVKESARIFAIPTYIFIVSMLIMIVTGIVRVNLFGYQPQAIYQIPQQVEDITLFLIIRAFAAGCAGLTGVEAVSNAIPNFNEPSQKNAKRVLGLLALFVLLIFGGTSYLATMFHAVPTTESTVLSQIVSQVFGQGNIMFYILQVSTAVILVMAANTSYAGLPMLLALVARDGYMPRQFNVRGGRLSFSNGIIVLGIAAGLLVVLYNGETHALIPLYAIGVFLSFTLSQLGMFVKWTKGRGKGWLHKAVINGAGLLLTALTVFSIAYSKMLDGAWISVVCIVLLIFWMKATRRHYKAIAQQLELHPEDVAAESGVITVDKHVIVLLDSLNKASLKAINYAKLLADDQDVIAFHVSLEPERAKRIREKWERCGMDIPLVIKYSPYRDIIGTLMKYVKSEEYGYKMGDMLTLVMPQFIVDKPWMNIYHNQTAYMIRHKFLHDPHVAVVIVPYVMKHTCEKPHGISVRSAEGK